MKEVKEEYTYKTEPVEHTFVKLFEVLKFIEIEKYLTWTNAFKYVEEGKLAPLKIYNALMHSKVLIEDKVATIEGLSVEDIKYNVDLHAMYSTKEYKRLMRAMQKWKQGFMMEQKPEIIEKVNKLTQQVFG